MLQLLRQGEENSPVLPAGKKKTSLQSMRDEA
jgi:hypothetical protein